MRTIVKRIEDQFLEPLDAETRVGLHDALLRVAANHDCALPASLAPPGRNSRIRFKERIWFVSNSMNLVAGEAGTRFTSHPAGSRQRPGQPTASDRNLVPLRGNQVPTMF